MSDIRRFIANWSKILSEIWSNYFADSDTCQFSTSRKSYRKSAPIILATMTRGSDTCQLSISRKSYRKFWIILSR